MSATPLSQEHLHVMQHALGLDEFGFPPKGYKGCRDDNFPGCYRNHFVTDSSSPDGLLCETLVTAGLMAKPNRQPGFIGSMTNYHVTAAGYAHVKAESPSKPKITRAKQRYRDYLDCADLFPDGFGQYLRYRQANA